MVYMSDTEILSGSPQSHTNKIVLSGWETGQICGLCYKPTHRVEPAESMHLQKEYIGLPAMDRFMPEVR